MPKGPFKDHLISPSVGWSISDGSYELVEADGLEANTKRTLKPSGLNRLVGSLSVRSFGCAALEHGLALAFSSLSAQR